MAGKVVGGIAEKGKDAFYKMNASDDEGTVVNISDDSKGNPSDGITDDGDLDWLNVSDDSKGNPSDGTTDDKDLDW